MPPLSPGRARLCEVQKTGSSTVGTLPAALSTLCSAPSMQPSPLCQQDVASAVSMALSIPRHPLAAGGAGPGMPLLRSPAQVRAGNSLCGMLQLWPPSPAVLSFPFWCCLGVLLPPSTLALVDSLHSTDSAGRQGGFPFGTSLVSASLPSSARLEMAMGTRNPKLDGFLLH
jgi:hypothetical protein